DPFLEALGFGQPAAHHQPINVRLGDNERLPIQGERVVHPYRPDALAVVAHGLLRVRIAQRSSDVSCLETGAQRAAPCGTAPPAISCAPSGKSEPAAPSSTVTRGSGQSCQRGG